MRDGSVLTRSEKRYKPSTIESYASAVRDWIVPDVGYLRLAKISRLVLREITDRWRKDPRRPADGTIRNAIMPLRVTLRREFEKGLIPSNPAAGFKLPAVGRRERVANAAEVANLLEPLPVDLRALYGVAFHAGLRAGEIAALRWSDLEVDEERGIVVIHVREACRWKGRRFVTPKSDAGANRKMPVTRALERMPGGSPPRA